MCDFSQIMPYFVIAGAAIAAAITSLGVAIVLNNGFCSAPGSPGAMIAAGFSSAAAATTLYLAINHIDSYYECMGSPAACANELSNVIITLIALIYVLGIQSAACFTAAATAWVPWAGAIPMYAILTSLLAQSALIPSLYIFTGDLIECVTNEEAKTNVSVIVGYALVVSVALIGLTAYVRRKSAVVLRQRVKKEIE